MSEDTPSSLVDSERIHLLRDKMGSSQLASLASVIADSGADLVTQVEVGMASGEALQISESSHRLKGMARNIGLVALGDLAAEIQDAAAQGKIDQARGPIQALKDRFDRSFLMFRASLQD
ncbi:MAG: Hpt domain-containing protein [Magnetococcales bacterium]|nr:Hpt domain-containing protein [Magnetococcales bacterium]